MLIGEAPGYQESLQRRPFCGPSGRELNSIYLVPQGRHSSQFYLANLVPEYHTGNPNPTVEQIQRYTPQLEQEIRNVNPRVIIPTGKFSTTWLLGGSPRMLDIHGIPCEAGCFVDNNDKPIYQRRGNGAIIVPAIHPAAAMYKGGERLRASIYWDYEQALKVNDELQLIYKDVDESIDPVELWDFPCDDYKGQEVYEAVSGRKLNLYLNEYKCQTGIAGGIGIDTEGDEHNPWSVQVSAMPGTGVTLRCHQPKKDFQFGIDVLQGYADAGCLFIFHHALHDVAVCRAMGLDLSNARTADTMYMLFALSTEPQGLKPAVWRHCNMLMKSYVEVVGGAVIDKQLEYLRLVRDANIPKIDKVDVLTNYGTTKPYGPESPSSKAKKILKAFDDGKLGGEDDDDEVVISSSLKTLVYKRWYNTGRPIRGGIDHAYVSQKLVQRRIMGGVEEKFGPMPMGGLGDVEDQNEAMRYECRDPDATRRLYFALIPKLKERGLI